MALKARHKIARGKASGASGAPGNKALTKPSAGSAAQSAHLAEYWPMPQGSKSIVLAQTEPPKGHSRLPLLMQSAFCVNSLDPFLICEGCGLICEEYQHHDARMGCLFAFLTAPAALLFLKFVIGSGWLAAIFGAWFGMFAVLWGVTIFNRIRWRRQNAALKLRACPACRGKKFVPVSRANGKSLMCPHCHTLNMRYDAAGIS